MDGVRSSSLTFDKYAYENFNTPLTNKPTLGDIRLSGEYFSKGNIAFEKKKYKLAIKNFTKSYDLDYVMIDAVYNRALVHHTMGNLENACEDWKHLADLGQKDAMKYLEEYCK
jgi:tetratricopeptide (TPR) repeat protein